MVRMHFGPEDLAQVRFAFSPLVETALSLVALRDTSRHALHLPWVRSTRRRVEGLDLEVLEALVPGGWGYIPDFLAPPPDEPETDFAAALERMRATDPEVVRREARRVAEIRPDRLDVVEPLVHRPEEALDRLADRVEEYWERALAPHWSDMLGLLEGEVLYRARSLAVEGAGGLFRELHRQVSYADGTLSVEKPFDATLELGGRGLLLVPSVFTWPDVYVGIDRPWQPTVWYPARGVGWLWNESPPDTEPGLEQLVGETRARVLQSVHEPATTTEVARRLGLSPSTVSGHFSRLSRTGLLRRTRIGRRVFYSLAPEGRELLALFETQDRDAPGPEGADGEGRARERPGAGKAPAGGERRDGATDGRRK